MNGGADFLPPIVCRFVEHQARQAPCLLARRLEPLLQRRALELLGPQLLLWLGRVHLLRVRVTAGR